MSSRDESKQTSSNRPVPLPIWHFCVDIGVVLLLFLGLEALARNIGPRESGFFCDDKSIRMPYTKGTFSLAVLILYCVTLNLVVVLCVETYRGIRYPNKLYSKYEQHRSTYAKIGIRFVIFFAYFLAFEFLVSIITTYTKYPIGRLRPYFLEVCRPIVELPEGNRSIIDSGCKGLENVFLTNYTCIGTNKMAIKESRLSFFSGHSSLAVGASSYAILYLQFRLIGRMRCKLVVPVLQVIIGGCGLFISYSRIFDYCHHWADVAVGIAVGIVVMLLLTRFVAGFFTSNQFVEPPPRPRDQITNPKRSFEGTEAYS